MTLRSSDLQSDSDLDSIRNSCDVNSNRLPAEKKKEKEKEKKSKIPGIGRYPMGPTIILRASKA